jgi:cytochrome oxidase Cu insertion factor (SCO1/SenC/PrrC family)
MLLFVLPVVAATLLYFAGWRPATSGNHGELIRPARQIEDLALQTLDGQPARFSALRGKWTMAYFGASSCPDACMKSLYAMRQVHTAQGKERDRVRRVFILAETNALGGLKAKLADYPGMYVWTGEKKALAELAQSFGMREGSAAEQPGIYLVDPLGNLIMRYAPGTDPAGMLKDMTRLLKYSWVG